MSEVTPEELKEAMALNERMARVGSYANLADDLISKGNEVLVNLIPTYDRSTGSFAGYAYAHLLSRHRREFIDLIAGVHVPSQIAQYNSRSEGISRLELDGFP